MSEIMNDTELFLELTEDLDITPRCESWYCADELGRDSHEADWIVRYDQCEHSQYWCNDRFLLYRKDLLDHGTAVRHKCSPELHQSIIWWAPVRS